MSQAFRAAGSLALRNALGEDERWVSGLLDGCASVPELLSRLG